METIIVLILLPIFISAAIAGISAAPWLPTKQKQRDQLLNVIEIPDGTVCYDLGCGDGTMLFALAKKNPNLKAIGYDISVLPWLMGNIRKLVGGKKFRNVSIRYGNLFKQSLPDADLVFVFLLSKAYPRLIEKFKNELDDHATVIVEAWPLPGIEPKNKLKSDGLLPVYFYRGSQFK